MLYPYKRPHAPIHHPAEIPDGAQVFYNVLVSLFLAGYFRGELCRCLVGCE